MLQTLSVQLQTLDNPNKKLMGLDILLDNNDNTNKYIVIYSKLVYQITHKSRKMLQNQR